MSTQLRNVTTNMAQTRFFGGETRGVCVQVSQKSFKDGHQFLQLTKQEAALLASEDMKLKIMGRAYEQRSRC